MRFAKFVWLSDPQEAQGCGEGSCDQVLEGQGGGRTAGRVPSRVHGEQGEDGTAPVVEDNRIIRQVGNKVQSLPVSTFFTFRGPITWLRIR
jgi:hypothetical protein